MIDDIVPIYYTRNSYQIRENVRNAQFKVRTRQENVSGVMLPAFEKWVEGGNGMLLFIVYLYIIVHGYGFILNVWIERAAFELTGLGRGGQLVQKCKDTYAKALEALIEIATLQVRAIDFFECY